MTDGFGNITFWGFSPALDLQECHYDVCVEMKKEGVEPNTENEDTLNILLVGAGDIRHVFKTISQSWRHRKRKLNFYIIENSLELYARDMLLLSLVLDSPQRLGIRDKTEYYLEIFANLLIRQQSVDYIKKMAHEMIKMITDSDYLAEKMPILDLSRLKYKEIDMLEGISKFWRKADRAVFDAHNHWDMRLRQYLGVRYDAIPNVFDWDFSMKLCDRGAEVINSKVYSKWRLTGVAYAIRDGTYNQPNFTLASGLLFKKDGERLARRGYWGDILVSPYIGHGIESEEEKFFKKQNNALTQTSIDVSQYNVTALFHELLHQSEFKPMEQPEMTSKSPPEPLPSATLSEITEESEEILENSPSEDTSTTTQEIPEVTTDPLDQDFTSLPLEDVKVILLPLKSTDDLHEKERYAKLFNIVYFSNSMVHHFKKDLTTTFADQAHVILETAKFMLELKPEQLTEFGKKITGIAGSAGCKTLKDFDGAKDSFIHMVYRSS